MDKRLSLFFPKKGNIRINNNYRGITLTSIAAKIYNALLLKWINREKFQEKFHRFSEKSLLNFRDSDDPSNNRRITRKNIEATIVYGFLQWILFHDKRDDWANSIWHMFSLKKLTAIMMIYKNTEAVVRSANRDINWYCHWSFTRRYIRTIFVYNLPRLCTLNVDISNQRKWLYTKKSKK